MSDENICYLELTLLAVTFPLTPNQPLFDRRLQQRKQSLAVHLNCLRSSSFERSLRHFHPHNNDTAGLQDHDSRLMVVVTSWNIREFCSMVAQSLFLGYAITIYK